MRGDAVTESLRRAIDWLDTPEGEASVAAYCDKIKRENAVLDSQTDRYWSRYGGNQDAMIYRILAKYNTDAYRNRWYRKGVEPPEGLLWFLRSVAIRHGRELTPTEYATWDLTEFTHDVYVMDGWVFEMMVGQGSALLVYRAKQDA